MDKNDRLTKYWAAIFTGGEPVRTAFNRGAVWALAEVLRSNGDVASAFHGAGFTASEIEDCVETDVKEIREQLGIVLPEGEE